MFVTANLTDPTITLMSDDDAIQLRMDFETFVRSEYPALLGVATALTGGAYDAQDIVQDTMVKALIRWERVSLLDRPGGWAHRVLVNGCVGWWRRRRTEARFLARMRRVEPSVAGPSPDTLAFWQAVRRLPARHQQVMALHYAGDLSLEEVANVLSVPSGTVRSDLSRARTALAVLLKD